MRSFLIFLEVDVTGIKFVAAKRMQLQIPNTRTYTYTYIHCARKGTHKY